MVGAVVPSDPHTVGSPGSTAGLITLDGLWGDTCSDPRDTPRIHDDSTAILRNNVFNSEQYTMSKKHNSQTTFSRAF